MSLRIASRFFLFLFLCALNSIRGADPSPIPAAGIDEKTFKGMQWRQVGPFRGGRALAVEGGPGEPNTYYFGAVAGGGWKTTDSGADWSPIFDKQHTTSSIGANAGPPPQPQPDYPGR